MMNKFLEIKAIEEQIQKEIAAEKKRGEEAVIEAENQEEAEIAKMREAIKEKRHQLLEQAKKEGLLEAEKIQSQTQIQISNMIQDHKLNTETAQTIAQNLFLLG